MVADTDLPELYEMVKTEMINSNFGSSPVSQTA